VRLILDKTITYHDSCCLGRCWAEEGIYDEPRQILESIPGVELVEMRDNRELALCCGGGAGGRARSRPAPGEAEGSPGRDRVFRRRNRALRFAGRALLECQGGRLVGAGRDRAHLRGAGPGVAGRRADCVEFSAAFSPTMLAKEEGCAAFVLGAKGVECAFKLFSGLTPEM